MKNGGTRRVKKQQEKPAYSSWQNIGYAVQGAWRLDKLFFLYFGAYTVISALIPFLTLFFPRSILAELLGNRSPSALIILLLTYFASSCLLGGLAAYLQEGCMPHMVSIRMAFLNQLQEKCLSTDFRNTEDPQFLNDMQTAYRCLQYNDQGIEELLNKLFLLAGKLLAFTGYIAILGTLHPLLLLFLIVSVLLSYALNLHCKKFEYQRKDELSDLDRRGWYLHQVMYHFSYGKEIRLFGLQDWITRRFQEQRNKRLTIDTKIRRRRFQMGLVDILLMVLREGSVYAYLLVQVVGGNLSVPDFTMYVAAVSGFAGWCQGILLNLAEIRAQNLFLCDLRRFLEKEEHVTGQPAEPLPPPPYTFTLRDVSFRYPGSTKDALSGWNLTIPAGQSLAVVGRNGSGKTTLIKLLCRLYDVSQGEILLNGINIKKFDQEAYFRLFSVVFQDVHILAFSAAENVALCPSEQVDSRRLKQALRESGIAKKIETLPKGTQTCLQTDLDETGIQLSGGEQQKVAIARALYKNSPLMILDEPTAALDALAEHQVYRQFHQMVQDKTALFVSHRLASTQFCHQIILLEDGCLAEMGTHRSLLAQDGKYAELFRLQAQYYREEEAGS